MKAFKSLHNARKAVFREDELALEASRRKINEEYRKNKYVTDAQVIKELVKFSHEVEKELKSQVVQARQVRPGHYELRITPETEKLDNFPFKDVPEEVLRQQKRKTKCGSDKKSNK